VFDANLTSTFNCTRAVVPGMKKAGWGRIVNISSGAGRAAGPLGIAAYSAAKAAQISFTRQMAYELGQYGITVNCITPGFVLSNPTTILQWENFGEDGQAAFVNAISLRRLGDPKDIAGGVGFFVSEAASWISGQVLPIDGGNDLF
jgi:3-oxoacyl-[acyl-carrier protein] reductase